MSLYTQVAAVSFLWKSGWQGWHGHPCLLKCLFSLTICQACDCCFLTHSHVLFSKDPPYCSIQWMNQWRLLVIPSKLISWWELLFLNFSHFYFANLHSWLLFLVFVAIYPLFVFQLRYTWFTLLYLLWDITEWFSIHIESSEVTVAQSCLTLCDPMDYTVHGILQARILEWVAFPFFRGSSQPRDRT